jgi:type VI secretion system protein ImpK
MSTNTDDPFAPRPDDRTIMVPTPRRAQQKSTQPPTTPPSRTPPPSGAIDRLPPAEGANPLIAAATPLLNLIPQLRAVGNADAVATRARMVEGIAAFEKAARDAKLPSQHIVAARYVLCTFIDETAANTPWGGSGRWSAQSLLVHFHNEAWGGEKTFQLLSKLAQDVPANRDLLELIEVCLAMGFQGRFRAVDNGSAQLMQVRERLFELLRQVRGELDRQLSPAWAGVALGRSKAYGVVPLWVVAAGTAVLLAALFVTFSTLLNRKSDPVFVALRSIEAPVALARAAAQPPPQIDPVRRPLRLRELLADDIATGRVGVADLPDRSVVTIRSDGFFAPASSTIPDPMRPLIDRIAEAIDEVPGEVLVVGHSDNTPIRSMRFPSNWHLSNARAEAVSERLSRTIDRRRLRAEGRAESEPIAPNDSPEGRARNRRVDVHVLPN